MKPRTRPKLTLATETLRSLSAARLRQAAGGTVLVTETDPVTAPKTDRGSNLPSHLTYYTCTCGC